MREFPRVQGITSHHFDYLASPEMISEKLKSFSHQEYSGDYWTNPERIRACIEQGFDLFERESGQVWSREDLTDQYPDTILESPELYRNWIV